MKIFDFFSSRRQSTDGRRIGQGISLVVVLFAAVTVAHSNVLMSDLPSLGQQDIRTQNQETSAGLRYLRFINAQGLSTQDPAVTYYLEQSMLPLLPSFSGEGGVDELLIFGVNHSSFNAFALPGGLIGVHHGLLAQLNETAEVQAIMAHELSHLALGHHQRLAQSRRQSTGLIIASILLAPLALQVDTDLAIGMIYGAQGLAIQQQLAFSRSMEEEADRMAVSAMRGGGLPLSGFAGAYGTMADNQRLQTGSAGTLYPTTHPDVRARLADLQNRIRDESPRANTVPDIALCWVQLDNGVRARAPTDDRCIDYRTVRDSEGADRFTAWATMLEQYPANPYLIFRAAEWTAGQRDHSGADALLDTLTSQAALAPDSWLVALAMMTLDQNLNERERLHWRQTLYNSAPGNDLTTWNTLRLAYPEERERHRAFRAQAQTSWINGDMDIAVRQLRRAVELSSASTERTQWETLLRRWERAQDR